MTVLLEYSFRGVGSVIVTCDYHVTAGYPPPTPHCRRLLLNSVLLCAASDAGDEAEVTRLLSECHVPANVCGLRHKAPLHLAASQGHCTVVATLLASGVRYLHSQCWIPNHLIVHVYTCMSIYTQYQPLHVYIYCTCT